MDGPHLALAAPIGAMNAAVAKAVFGLIGFITTLFLDLQFTPTSFAPQEVDLRYSEQTEKTTSAV
jgi:hypothetical protein